MDYLQSPQCGSFCEILSTEFSVSQIVRGITHVNSCIDLLFIPSKYEHRQKVDLLPPLENHHKLVFCSVNFPVQHRAEPPVPRWSYRRADWLSFNILMQGLDLVAKVAAFDDVDSAWDLIRKSILSCAEQSIPKSFPRKTKSWMPWISEELRQLIRKRDNLYKRLKKSHSDSVHRKFIKLRNIVRKRIFTDKKLYFQEKLDSCTDPRLFWRVFNQFCGKSKNTVGQLHDQGRVVETDVAKASLFSQFYQDSCNPDDIARFDTDSLDCQIPNSAYVNLSFIHKSLDSLSTKKSTGSDDISPTILKFGSSSIAPVLFALFNMCIKLSTLPTQFKQGIVVPINKIPSPTLVSQYRPITLILVCAKLFEKYLVSLIKPHILPKLSDSQFAYRPYSSTIDALYNFDFRVSKGLDLHSHVAAVHIDIQRAFDHVPYNALLKCLSESYHLPGHLLKLLQNYFTGRTQMVRVGASISEPASVTSGVPQGSVIAPWLFLAYINSVTQIKLSPCSHISLFADDIVYIHSLKNQNCTIHMQTDLDSIADHLKSKLLSINPTKSKLQIFGRSQRAGSVPNFDVTPTINLVPVAKVDQVTYLGVTFDNALNYSLNSRLVCAKTKRNFCYIYRTFRKAISKHTIVKLYKSLFRVSLLYSCESTYPSLQVDRIRLERTQKFVTRLITGRFRNANTIDVSYDWLLSQFRLEPIWKTVYSKRLCLIHSYVNGFRHSPPNMITLKRDSHLRSSSRTNHNGAIIIPHCKTVRFNSSAFISSATAYNLLPADSINLSKLAFKKYVNSQPCLDSVISSITLLDSKIITVIDI